MGCVVRQAESCVEPLGGRESGIKQ
jgi:hypothetical protein